MNKLELHKAVKIYKKLPKGWEILENATTAPVGYKWIFNRKSLFSKERKRALLKSEN